MSDDPDPRYPTVCPYVIGRPTMRMTWEELTLLHWRYPAEEVQRLIPDALTVEEFDGSAWVGLVPFHMRVDVPFLPSLPRFLHFPETNVRTYVTDRQGRVGVWFFSLEASSPLAVVAARATYRVPYFRADMTIEPMPNAPGEESWQCRTGDRFAYRATRRWPGPRGARSRVDVVVGEPFGPGEAGPIDRFLTARWALYGTLGPVVVRAEMHHEPWPLWHAEVEHLEDELVAAAGLTPPRDRPLVHFSPGVHVRCGWPGLAGR